MVIVVTAQGQVAGRPVWSEDPDLASTGEQMFGYSTCASRGASVLQRMPGRPMREYIVVPGLLAFDQTADEWARRYMLLMQEIVGKETQEKELNTAMLHAEETVTIHCQAGEVFDYLADGTHNREWRLGVLEIARTSSTDGLGATYRQVLSGPGGRRIDGDYRVTEFDPPHRLAFQVTAGPARPTGVFELTDEAGATRVRFALDLDPAGPLRLMTPMISRQMRREAAQIACVKSILESGN